MPTVSPDSIRTPRDLAPLLEHTLLKEDAGEADVLRTCEEALRHRFAGGVRALELGGAGGPGARRDPA